MSCKETSRRFIGGTTGDHPGDPDISKGALEFFDKWTKGSWFSWEMSTLMSAASWTPAVAFRDQGPDPFLEPLIPGKPHMCISKQGAVRSAYLKLRNLLSETDMHWIPMPAAFMTELWEDVHGQMHLLDVCTIYTLIQVQENIKN